MYTGNSYTYIKHIHNSIFIYKRISYSYPVRVWTYAIFIYTIYTAYMYVYMNMQHPCIHSIDQAVPHSLSVGPCCGRLMVRLMTSLNILRLVPWRQGRLSLQTNWSWLTREGATQSIWVGKQDRFFLYCQDVCFTLLSFTNRLSVTLIAVDLI